MLSECVDVIRVCRCYQSVSMLSECVYVVIIVCTGKQCEQGWSLTES
jgi:hypothetical protein